jgi:hypothetical protein
LQLYVKLAPDWDDTYALVADGAAHVLHTMFTPVNEPSVWLHWRDALPEL